MHINTKRFLKELVTAITTYERGTIIVTRDFRKKCELFIILQSPNTSFSTLVSDIYCFNDIAEDYDEIIEVFGHEVSFVTSSSYKTPKLQIKGEFDDENSKSVH